MRGIDTTSKERQDRYEELLVQLTALVDGEPDLIANLANVTAAVNAAMPPASWVGFYFLRDGELVLGPFQGKVACIRIALGRGVCGTAAATRETVIVGDVDEYPGHIACDADTRSEVVVPLVVGDRLLGVLDVDSYQRAAFDRVDADLLERVARLASGLAGWHE